MLFFKKIGLILAICAITNARAEAIRGLLGGQDNLGDPWVGTFPASSNVVTPISFGFTSGTITTVALNNSSLGLLGGQALGAAYLATIDSSSTLTRIFKTPDPGRINSVALNDLGIGLAGGFAGSAPYVAIISSNNAAPISTGFSSGAINSVAINNSNIGLIGGRNGSNMYVSWTTPTIPIVPITGLGAGQIIAVATNDSGFGLVGGLDGANNGVAYTIPSVSNVATQVFSSANSLIQAVALNNQGEGIIGGAGVGIGGFVGLVSNGITAAVIEMPNPAIITSVAINNGGKALAGGRDENNLPYAATIDLDSTFVTRISLGFLGSSLGFIQDVALNDFGQGLIGGRTNGFAFAALVDSNTAIPLALNLPANSFINSVDLENLMPLLSHIVLPSTVSGNSKIFANYINKYASQKAFYFVPSEFDGTLAQALESSAPTRNAISFNTVLQNSFYLTTSLATHLHDGPFFRKRGTAPQTRSSTTANASEGSESLIAALHTPEQKGCPQTCVKEKEDPCQPSHPYSIWFDAVGALAYQNRQHQTTAFDPATGGAIVGFEGKVTNSGRVGGGASYLYTHVHEKHNAGHSNINQEALFLYSSWNSYSFYLDLAAWGGLFQTEQKRNIQMTGFAFTSKSNVSGGMLTPHLELGYNGIPTYTQHFQFTYNPFGMLDWANGWQDSYKEKGTGPFNAGQKSHYGSLLRTEVGIRFSEVFFFPCWNLVLQEKGSYVNTQSFSAGQMNAFLVGSPGSFTVETLTSAQNLGVAQLLVSFAPLKPVYPVSTIFYQGEFGSGYQSHQLNLEFAWHF